MARLALLALGAVVAMAASSPKAGRGAAIPLDPPRSTAELAAQPNAAWASRGTGSVRVIVQTTQAATAERSVARAGGRLLDRLAHVGALVAEVSPGALDRLAASPGISSLAPDRAIAGAVALTSTTVGARWVQETLGFDGAGVGVAIIDSGVMASHEDLAPSRVVHFADFVGGATEPYDGYGHGTHVAGIIAGSGAASNRARRGIAPGAHLVVLKALDAAGQGHVSTAIAALDYAIGHRAAYNIRVINLSVAAGVYESYATDPLALAARRAVEAGIVVVTAAGNLGIGPDGAPQYGGITSPGNAPWVLTVGAASHAGTEDRADDTVAPFSSRGPTWIDMAAKPDLVAPGVGIESLADPAGTLFRTRSEARLAGAAPRAVEPYLRLSGTSMAAPVAAGVVALVLQANPALTPEAVKTVLKATARWSAADSQRAQGAGFLDARAAVDLALRTASSPGAAEHLNGAADPYPEASFRRPAEQRTGAGRTWATAVEPAE